MVAKKKVAVKKNNKFMLGAVIFFLLVAGLVYVFREAIFWKTYVDPRGFEFSFPSGWSLEVKKNPERQRGLLENLAEVKNDGVDVSIDRWYKSENLKLSSELRLDQMEKVSIDGNEYRFTVVFDRGLISTYYFIEKEDFLYKISVWSPLDNWLGTKLTGKIVKTIVFKK